MGIRPYERVYPFLRHHRTIWQEHSAKDFASYESYKRAGILYVFPPFITARMGQKIGRRPQTQLCGDALSFTQFRTWVKPLSVVYRMACFSFASANTRSIVSFRRNSPIPLRHFYAISAWGCIEKHELIIWLVLRKTALFQALAAFMEKYGDMKSGV